MRWLEGRLGQWNESAKQRPKKEDARVVRTAWFYPWKYQEREEVWRGLVAEVILACLDGKNYTLKSFTRDAKDLGRFLGRSIIRILSNVKISGGGVEAQTAALKDIARDLADTAAPEAAYLNEFETVMRDWVKRSLKKNERLVVFIDDLDRCMPDVALQALEALKLYLNIERLMFVVGVDKTVVDQLVVERYKRMGVDETKALDCLAKMFQVEIPLAPTEWEVEVFFADIVAKNETWKNLEHRQDALEPVIMNLAKRSPREVKRLVNSAMIHASGVRRSKLITATGVDAPSGAQSVQVFLVRRILGARTMETLAGSKTGTRFFRAWSAAVARDPDAAPTVHLTQHDIDALGRTRGDGGAHLEPADGKRGDTPEEEGAKVLEQVPSHFRELVGTAAFHSYLRLLGDDDLGALMRITYPEEAAVLGGLGGAGESQIVREAIARALAKPIDDVTPADFPHVTNMGLGNSDIEDVAPLAALTSLELLSLGVTQVRDLAPLAALANLSHLYLQGTQVQDLAPLQGLTRLKQVDLIDCSVRPGDIDALRKALPDARIKTGEGEREEVRT